ncbi:hypothetical protein JW948_07015 [bacterium]|nr:hypothetical protein [bacterium]
MKMRQISIVLICFGIGLYAADGISDQIQKYFDTLEFNYSVPLDSYLFTENGEMVFAYDFQEKLYMTILDPNGIVSAEKIGLLDNYVVHHGFESVFTEGDYVIVLAGFQFLGGRICIYNKKTQRIDILSIDDNNFSDITAGFDQLSNFHVLYQGGRKYIRLERTGAAYQIAFQFSIPETDYIAPNILNEEYLSFSHTSYVHVKSDTNYMTCFYYMTTPGEQNNISFVNRFDRLGVRIFNLHTLRFERMQMYSLEEIAEEMVEDVLYPKMNTLEDPQSKAFILFAGGKKSGKDVLYKIMFDPYIKPQRHMQKSVVRRPQLVEHISKENFFDVYIGRRDIDRENAQPGLIFSFIGFDKKNDKYLVHMAENKWD